MALQWRMISRPPKARLILYRGWGCNRRRGYSLRKLMRSSALRGCCSKEKPHHNAMLKKSFQAVRDP